MALVFYGDSLGCFFVLQSFTFSGMVLGQASLLVTWESGRDAESRAATYKTELGASFTGF